VDKKRVQEEVLAEEEADRLNVLVGQHHANVPNVDTRFHIFAEHPALA